jgi:hypothetical protein
VTINDPPPDWSASPPTSPHDFENARLWPPHSLIEQLISIKEVLPQLAILNGLAS